MMERYAYEKRMKILRRFYFHALDAIGLFVWCAAIIIISFCLIFLLWKR